MKKKSKHTKPALRMYFLVMYNISPIQQGIQALHAVVEYFLKHWKDKEFWRWALSHKTVVILNGGTSNDGHHSEYGEPKQKGTMETHFQTLKDNKIKCAAFYEPDLNYSCSAIAFLVDERVFNRKDYPDFTPIVDETVEAYVTTAKTLKAYKNVSTEQLIEVAFEEQKKEYVKSVGKDIAFLKEFLKPFRLA